MRNLVEVLDRIIAIIPPEEAAAIAAIRAVQTSARCTAPEVAVDRWLQAAFVIATHLGEPDTPWKQQVCRVFRGEEAS